VAEYVEDDELLAIVRELGTDYGQGYGIGKPQPLEAVLQGWWRSATFRADDRRRPLLHRLSAYRKRNRHSHPLPNHVTARRRPERDRVMLAALAL
jgi:hypothetical protein